MHGALRYDLLYGHPLHPTPFPLQPAAYLRDSAGVYSDPLHGHSFAGVTLRALPTVDRSLLFFRDCVLCDERLLAIGKPPTAARRRKLPSPSSVAGSDKPHPGSRTPGSGVCQCLGCGKFVHRECLSFAHRHRYCRGHETLMPVCSHAPPPVNALMLIPQDELEAMDTGNSAARELARRVGIRPEAFTLATLIEELANANSSSVAGSTGTGPEREAPSKGTKQQQQLRTASRYAKRLAPVLAAGGVVGAIALGPAAGVLAGLNMLVAGVGAETVMAGLGLTAGAAAAATVSYQSKVRAARRSRERMKKGEWAMEICWNCKKSFGDAPSDEACRKDAEFLRRFQIQDPRHHNGHRPGHSEAVEDSEGAPAAESMRQQTFPDEAEVYRFLFGIFASPSEFLGQMNVQLCEAFRQRFTARHQQRQLKPFPRPSSAKASVEETTAARALAKDTLQDAKMYVAHVLGATMQCFPSLASTPEAAASCTLAVERIVFDDIYATVFGEFQSAFRDADTAFADNLTDIRREQKHCSSPLFSSHQPKDGESKRPVLVEDLQKAESKMVTMMQATCSPLQKLMLLCDAFRSVCCFAEQLHQSASNADMLIPILCALLVECSRVCRTGSHFVAEIAFISFFTNGGGKGVEGYVLTTFQAAIQVIAAVDLPNGHAKELELFTNDDDDGGGAIDDAGGDEEFFDARSTAV
ncbi:hypothetical protein BBJ28_00006361 [Nothophytophthora sp. Chile5]|nr:hypothetical protein BBJ28_00006361 [Nothophytophthora sp. Chile5]